MNIKELHTNEKPVSTATFFKGANGVATAIQILKNQELKEHVTKIPACLICIAGEALFKNEQGAAETLTPGDYVIIKQDVKHWVLGITDCQLTLFK